MKLSKTLTPVVAGTALMLTGMVAPVTTASAASVEGNIGIANMYLWRGQNVANSGGQVQGGVSVSESGAYGGIWTSSESGGSETDLYIGYGGEASGFSYDVSYWLYWYPEDVNSNVSCSDPVCGYSNGDNDISDIVISLGYAGFNFSAYIQQSAPSNNTSKDDVRPASVIAAGGTPIKADATDDNTYYTLSYNYEKWTFLYGWWSLETQGKASELANWTGDDGYIGDAYSHIQVMYAPNDNLTFGFSKATSDVGQSKGGIEEDLLFYAAYNWTFDLTK